MELRTKAKELLGKIGNNPEFTLKEQLGYSAGSFGNAMGQDCVGTYTSQFFRDHMGLGSQHEIILKSTVKGVNIAFSPIIGYLLDNKSSSKTFMALSAIPLSIASVLLFTVPTGSVTFRFIYTFLLYLLFHIADSFYDISLLTMSSRMTTDTSARKTFYMTAQLASSVGSALPGWLVPVIVEKQGGAYEAEKWAYFTVALIFGILGLIAMTVPCLTLKERLAITPQKTEKSKTIDFKLILLNRPLLLLCLSQVTDSIRQVCYDALPFFYKQTMNNYAMKSHVEIASSTLSYLGLLSIPVIGKKLCARDIISFGYFHTGLCYILLTVLGYKHKLIVGILIALAGLPNYGMGAARKILLADSADYMEWKSYQKYGTAIRNEGMIFSFNQMCNRISSLWKDLMISGGLSLIGYKSATVNAAGQSVEAVQSAKTLKGIFYLVVIPGILGNIIPGIILRFDNFAGKKREEILASLAVIRKERVAEEKD